MLTILFIIFNRKEVPFDQVKKILQEQLNMRLEDVPGDGWCFLSALVLCLNDARVECMLDEVMIGIMEEITKNLDFYTHFMPSNYTPIIVKAKVLQYVTQKKYNNDVVDLFVATAVNAFGINVNIIEQHVTNEARMIQFTAEEVKSSVEIFLYYEHSIMAKKYLEGVHHQAVLRGHLVCPDVQMPVPEKSGKPKVQGHGHRTSGDADHHSIEEVQAHAHTTSRNADDHCIDIINYPTSDDDLRNIFNDYRIPSPPPKRHT